MTKGRYWIEMIRTLKKLMRPSYYQIRYRLSAGRAKVSLSSHHMVFHVSSKEDYQRALGFVGEKAIATVFMNRIRPGDVIWDVGANLGSYTLFASVVTGPEGAVYAFEPEPRLAQRLRANCAMNGLRNVNVREQGLSSRSQAVFLYVDDSPGSGKHKIEYDSTMRPIEIRVVPGDSLISGTEVRLPNLIKIDVEGHESDVLSGLEETLSYRNLHTVLCEIHANGPKDSESGTSLAVRSLSTAGFSDMQRFERGSELHILATRALKDGR